MVFTQPNYTAARALCYTGHKTNSRQLLRAQIQRMKKALLTLHPLLVRLAVTSRIYRQTDGLEYCIL